MTQLEILTLAKDHAFDLWGTYVDMYCNSKGEDEETAKRLLEIYREKYLELKRLIKLEREKDSPMSL